MIRSLAQPHPADKMTRRSGWIATGGEILALVVLIGLLTAGLIAIQQQPTRYSLDDVHESLDGLGWYGVEQHGLWTYRWSAGQAEVRLPLRYNSGRRYLAVMTARSLHPDGPQPIRFFLNDRLLTAFTPADRELRTYRLLLAPMRGDAGMQFGFSTNAFVPAGDNRELGLLVTRLEIRHIPALDWTIIAGAPLGLLAMWGSMRWHASRWLTLVIVALQAAVALVAATLYRPTALPFIWFALPVMAAAALSVFVTRVTPARIGLTALVALVGYSGIIWSLAFTDDAFISFQYARNLVAGHGLVFNAGERVEGYTNFLWTMLAALTIWLGGDPVFWGYAAGILIGLTIVLVSYTVATSLAGPGWGLAAALLIASSQSVLVYTARGAGMETGLFTLLLLLSSNAYLSASRANDARRYGLAGFLFALTALTRPEGVMFFGLTVGCAAAALWLNNMHHRASLSSLLPVVVRSLLPLVVTFLIIFIPYFLWRWWYYGDILPNTFYAKTGGGVLQWVRGVRYLGECVLAFGGVLLVIAAAAPFAASAGGDPSVRDRWYTALATPAGYLWILCVVYLVYVIYTGGDHFPGERFFVPIVPWLALLIVIGMAALIRLSVPRRALRLAYVVATLAIAVTAWMGLNRGETLERRLAGNDESVWIWADLGVWLYRNTPPDASIAAAGVGAIAYYSQRETIDLHGLTDRHIARVVVENMGSGPAGHEKRDPEYVLNVRRPTYIPRWWESYFGGSAVLRQQYALITIRTDRGYRLDLWQRLPSDT